MMIAPYMLLLFSHYKWLNHGIDVKIYVIPTANVTAPMLTCLVPLAYLFVTVNYAGYWMIKNVYLNPDAAGYSMLNGILSIIMLILGVIILISAIKKWSEMWSTPQLKMDINSN
jgi:carbon starvation protein CstA